MHLDQLKSTFDSFSDAWRTNDGAAVASFFAEDGAVISPLRPARRRAHRHRRDVFRALRGHAARHVDDVQSQQRPPGRGQPRVCRRRTDHPWPDGQVILAVHIALLRREEDRWRVIEARPYAFAPMPA